MRQTRGERWRGEKEGEGKGRRRKRKKRKERMRSGRMTAEGEEERTKNKRYLIEKEKPGYVSLVILFVCYFATGMLFQTRLSCCQS